MNKKDIKAGGVYVTNFVHYKRGQTAKALTTDDPARWRTAIVLDTAPMRISWSQSEGMPCAVALYHPDLAPNPEWKLEIVRAPNLVLPYDVWLADMEPQVTASLESQREARERMEKEAKEREERAKDEAKLRSILNAFGINDSDGWRGVMTKNRWSDDKGGHVLTTYVRHLTLDDVLRLTGGKEKP